MLEIVDLLAQGPIPYRDAWELQKQRVQARQEGKVPDALILLEHPPTVTFGKAARAENRLLSEGAYAERGIELVPTDRGGDATYHGPGQLVGYPVLHLGEGNRDLHRYLRFLEAVLADVATDFGISGAGRADWHAGVWVGEGYLAALGVKVSRWVTHHGFALNVTEEVQKNFATIVPCGVAGKHIVSLSGLAGKTISVQEAAVRTACRFLEYYERLFCPETPAVAGDGAVTSASTSR